MRIQNCFYLGHISRVHGYKGAVVAVFDTDRPEAYTELESVFVEDHGELIPFFIEGLARNSKGHFILDLEDIDGPSAEKMVGRELWLPLDRLPPLSGKQFYYHEVIDFALYEGKNCIGHCRKILEQAAQPLFVVEGLQGEDILIPAVDSFIVSINRAEKKIELQLPEGLLELYRNED